MSRLKNDRLIRALNRQPVDATPIWVMRQAGRYLPEYRAVRAKAGSFLTLCKTPELACEVTLQPLRRYELDASILFSDILTIPDAMGLGLHFVEGEGPQFTHPLRTATSIQQLTPSSIDQLEYVYDAIKLIQHELDGKLPLIGFCGSPWTVGAYAVEGRAKNGFPTLLKMLKKEPALLHLLLEKFALSICAHLNAQIEAGVQVVMIFDTWGGMLDTANYEAFSLHYVKKIIAGLKPNANQEKVPVILFTKGGGQWLEMMAQSGSDALGVDWNITLQEARARVGQQVALQGNLNPSILLSSPEIIRDEVQKVLTSFGPGAGHIFNLGHGITPDVPPEHVAVLVDAVHEFSRTSVGS